MLKLNRALTILSHNRRLAIGMAGAVSAVAVGCMYMVSRVISATKPEPPKKLPKLNSNSDGLNTDEVDESGDFTAKTIDFANTSSLSCQRSDESYADDDKERTCCETIAQLDANRKQNQDKRIGKKKKMKKQSAQKECKLPPNYFIAVRIRNNEILTKLKSIQENIVKTKEDLKHALISADTFHLTLCVLRIDGEDELNKADQLMETFQQKLRERNDLRKLFLTVQGLDHFRNQVVFAKVKNDENFAQLEKLADTVVSCFEESKMVIKDHEKFTPHLTLAKLSKAPLLRTKRIKAISRDSYADFAEDTFGVEEVDSVQLLSMSKRKAEDGYYYCQKEISLTD